MSTQPIPPRSRLPVGGFDSASSASSSGSQARSKGSASLTSGTTASTSTSVSSAASRIKRQRSALPRPSTWFASPSKTNQRRPSLGGCTSGEDEDDFVMVSMSPKSRKNGGPLSGARLFGVRPAASTITPNASCASAAYGVTMAAERLSLMEPDDNDLENDHDETAADGGSPIHIPVGQSRSLGPAGRGQLMGHGRRRSISERESPECARRFTSASVVSGASVRVGAEGDAARSWMKRARADLSPMTSLRGGNANGNVSSPPPPDTPIHAYHTASKPDAAGYSMAKPPPQPVFPSLRPAGPTFSTDEVFLSPHSTKTAPNGGDLGTSTTTGRRFAGAMDGKENGLFSAKKSVSFEGLGQGSMLARSSLAPGSSARGKSNAHRRATSTDQRALGGLSGRHSTGGMHSQGGALSRSHGLKSGLAASASTAGAGVPKSLSTDSHASTASSAASSSTALTVPDVHMFDDVKPLAAAFEDSAGPVSRKFKPRDSGVGFADGAVAAAGQPGVFPVAIVPIKQGDGNGAAPPPQSKMALRSGTGGSALSIKPVRPQLLKRASSCGDERQSPVETPGLNPLGGSAWPTRFGLDFMASAQAANASADGKPSMPDTPVKRHAFSLGGATSTAAAQGKPHDRVSQSVSQPSLAQSHLMSTRKPAPPLPTHPKDFIPAYKPTCSFGRPAPSGGSPMQVSSSSSPMESSPSKPGPSLIFTAVSPDSPIRRKSICEVSPTVALGTAGRAQILGAGPRRPSLVNAGASRQNVRMGLLRRLSTGVNSGSSEVSEGENTPTKKGSTQTEMLAPGRVQSPLDSPTLDMGPPKVNLPTPLSIPVNRTLAALSASDTSPVLAPRLSLPHFVPAKTERRLNHRQSAPGTTVQSNDDLFEQNFVVLESLGKGAFSQVFKVQERNGPGVFAVKKARGVFEGVKDRLRHLEEVDILRHLSSKPHPHVIDFVDAWEQNRQLFIQTELCLGSLAFFLEEYGKIVERLDEGRSWKIARELADGIEYIHDMGVIHFDLKPANILINAAGSLKIGDFGLASRWPRVGPAAILIGAGLGGDASPASNEFNKIADREGDRVYMPPEMLRGHFSMAADIFSYGLMILEVATNICVPDGGAAWHALRQDDFSIVDFSSLSPALTDLITTCMRSNPLERPAIHTITQHPVIARARAVGKEALTPEADMFLITVLTGDVTLPPTSGDADRDIVMADA